jgi:predicted nicotinamide N-methyase
MAATPFLTINRKPIYFSEDWDTGIGGGLWSTGLAMAKYIELQQKEIETNIDQSFGAVKKLDILELGSGNGFLSVCLLALLQERILNLVTTDLSDHLSLIMQTLDANKHLPQTNLTVVEHRWGEFSPSAANDQSMEARIKSGNQKFDLIVGSDVAYRPDLYDILIESLRQFSLSTTVILLGVTMKDTTPAFFHKLRDAEFNYDRLADHLLPLEFRGNTFGIFVIRKV